MSLAVENTQPLVATAPDTAPAAVKPRAPLFSGLGEWVESHAAFSVTLLLAIFACVELGYSLRQPLWHDEVFTVSIAQAPTLRDLLHLTQTVDLNPPLSYLLTRAALHIAGVGTLQARLPELLGFALALACIFLFVRRRAGAAYGLLAAAVVFSSRAAEPAIDARPYGLLLGFAALALVAWQGSVAANERQQSTLRHDLLLCLACTALLLTHIFGLLIWGAIVAAEAANALQTRRIVFPRLIALTIPLAATVFYAPLFRLHTGASYPPAFQAYYGEILEYYWSRTDRGLLSLAVTIAVVALVAGRQWLRPGARFPFTRSESVAAGIIFLAPVALLCRLVHQHAAFFFRYGDFLALGLAVLIAGLLCWIADSKPTPAVLAAVIFLMFSSRLQHATIFAAQGHIFRHSEPVISLIDAQMPPDPAVPLVVNSGVDFTEMTYHEPADLTARTYYLTGGPIAVHYTNATIFEGMPLTLSALGLPGHTESYGDFLLANRRFYLLADDRDHPEDWLLRKLADDGATVRLVRHVDNSYSYHDGDLYEVTLSK